MCFDEILSPNCQIKPNGESEFRAPSPSEIFESGNNKIDGLVGELGKCRDAVFEAVENTGCDPFAFGADWACSDPTSVGDFIQEVFKNFTLVKKEEG
jgi:hypothetical protein